jgi:hypothetical protein
MAKRKMGRITSLRKHQQFVAVGAAIDPGSAGRPIFFSVGFAGVTFFNVSHILVFPNNTISRD